MISKPSNESNRCPNFLTWRVIFHAYVHSRVVATLFVVPRLVVPLLVVPLLVGAMGCGSPYRVESEPPGAWVRWKPGGGTFLKTPCEVRPGIDCGVIAQFVSVNWLDDDTSSGWEKIDGRSVYRFVKPARQQSQAEIDAVRAEAAVREAAAKEEERAQQERRTKERLELERMEREAALTKRIATLREDLRRIDLELAKSGVDAALRRELEIERKRLEAELAELEVPKPEVPKPEVPKPEVPQLEVPQPEAAPQSVGGHGQ